jgi:hypothetical protein
VTPPDYLLDHGALNSELAQAARESAPQILDPEVDARALLHASHEFREAGEMYFSSRRANKLKAFLGTITATSRLARLV